MDEGVSGPQTKMSSKTAFTPSRTRASSSCLTVCLDCFFEIKPLPPHPTHNLPEAINGYTSASLKPTREVSLYQFLDL